MEWKSLRRTMLFGAVVSLTIGLRAAEPPSVCLYVTMSNSATGPQLLSHLDHALRQLSGIRLANEACRFEVRVVAIYLEHKGIFAAAVMVLEPMWKSLAVEITPRAKHQEFLQHFSIWRKNAVITDGDLESLAKRAAADFHGSVILKAESY